MKKLLALLLAAVMVLGVFAACGKESGDDATPSTPNYEKVENPDTAGTLTVYAAAAVKVSYGADGLVLSLEGLNDDGKYLEETYAQELFGSSCTDAVNQIIKESVMKNFMFDTNYVVVKLNKGSALPGTSFLESVQSAAQRGLDTVASDAALVMVSEENLTEDGYIDLVTAKVLVEKFLGIDELDGFDGTDKPIDGMYAFDVTYGIMQEKVVMNAETGAVSQGAIEELEQTIEQDEIDHETEDDRPGYETPDETMDVADDQEETTDNTESAG